VTGADLATTADVARLERKLDEALERLARLAPPEYISLEETRHLLNDIDRATVRKMIDRGQLAARKAGRRWLVSVESIRTVTEARR
jgi:low affinity Fe/Cu permease